MVRHLRRQKLKVMECRAVEAHGEAPGTVLATKPLTVLAVRGRPAAECGAGSKKPMDGTAFAAGQRLKTGDIL